MDDSSAHDDGEDPRKDYYVSGDDAGELSPPPTGSLRDRRPDERHPAGHPWRRRFPDVEIVRSLEGGALYVAEAEGASWAIVDEGTMADFIGEEDADLLDELVKLWRFDTAPERDRFVAERWPAR